MAVFKPTPQQLAQFRTLASAADVAALFQTSTNRLAYTLYGQQLAYREFSIPKASGGERTILAPPKVISGFQRVLNGCIANRFAPRKPVHGFTGARSIVSNASQHERRRWVLNLDLSTFFDVINFGRVQGVFKAAPFKFPEAVASMLAHICCFRRRLPQGARTSPILSNLVCRGLDAQLAQFATQLGYRYTRYADDITFSGMDLVPAASLVENAVSTPPILSRQFVAIIEGEGFNVNPAKTRIRFQRTRQEVTGLTVNERVNVRRDFVRTLRGALHHWKRYGEAAANQRYLDEFAKGATGPQALRKSLQGRLGFLRMVKGRDDPVYVRLALKFGELTGGRSVVVAGDNVRRPELVAPCMWAVTGVDHDGNDVRSSTAFSVAGIGVVTSAHAFDDSKVAKWYLVPAWAPGKRIEIVRIMALKHHDLALCLDAPASPGSLARSHRRIGAGEAMTLIGFPKWSGLGEPPRIESGHVTRVRTISAVRVVATSVAIRRGNSGGPVCDSTGGVIGVARHGAGSTTEPHSCTSAEHFELLAGNATILEFGEGKVPPPRSPPGGSRQSKRVVRKKEAVARRRRGTRPGRPRLGT